MIIGPTSPPSAVPEAKGDLGKNEFLMLLVTQLRHQDPLNPMDATAFASQLAEFSGLEQLIQLNERFEAQADSTAMMSLSINTSLAASLVGRRVLAVGTQVFVPASGEASITVDVNGSGGSASLRLLDVNGAEIAVQNIGTVKGGRQTIPLNDLNLPSGVYTYELTVTDTDDIPVDVMQYSDGLVDGVLFANGAILLQAGGLLIPLARLIEIGAGPTTGE
jgi:flagellar basal-body rod modification protein FlgD